MVLIVYDLCHLASTCTDLLSTYGHAVGETRLISLLVVPRNGDQPQLAVLDDTTSSPLSLVPYGGHTGMYLSSCVVDSWQVDPRDKSYVGRLVRVLICTLHLQTENTALTGALGEGEGEGWGGIIF